MGCNGSKEQSDELSIPLVNPLLQEAKDARQSFRTATLEGLPPILAHVRAFTTEFFGHLHSFFSHRSSINAVYSANSVAGELEAVKVPATGIQNADQTFRPECRQQSVSGEPAQSLDELYGAADEAFEPLRELLETTCRSVSGVRFDISPPKGRERAAKKACDSYGGREPGPGLCWLYDIVRSSVYCEKGAGLKGVLEALVKQAQPGGVEIVKSKNRFKKPTPAGFRDVMVLVRLPIRGGRFFHVCEIQLHLTAVKAFDKEHDSHHHYEYFRDYFEGSMETVGRRLEGLRSVAGGARAEGEEGGERDGKGALRRAVEGAVQSADGARIQAMADLMAGYLCEHELAAFLYQLLIAARQAGGSEEALDGTYNNIAGVLEKQGKLGEAREYYDKALAIKIKALGPGHADVGCTYNNIAIVLQKQGKQGEAREYYDKALVIRIKALGPDHADVGGTYNNIAMVLRKQGKLDEAREYYGKALAIMIPALGPGHADVGSTYNNAAIVLDSQGKLDEAREYYDKALAIRINVLGPDHAYVGCTKYNIASLAKQQGDTKGAKRLFTEAAATYRATYGAGHSDTLDAERRAAAL